MSILSRPYFHDEAAAFAHVEALLWPQGAVCPHCGTVGGHYKLTGVRTKASRKNPDGVERHGLYKCGAKECRMQFTVRIGTIFEESHLPLHKWLQAIHLVCSSKKGISANQLHRTLETTLKTAWFLGHRIREAMRGDDLTPFGAGGGIVESDETFIGHDKTIKPKHSKKGRGWHHKHKVLTLIDRTTKRARSMVVDDLKAGTIAPIIRANIAKEARLMTDEGGHYTAVGGEFSEHGVVRHGAGEYVRGDAHTNTLEGYFSIFKRGMKGVYQHCGKKHLHRYVAEFEFRYNNRVANGVDDAERAILALTGITGKRLKYADSSVARP